MKTTHIKNYIDFLNESVAKDLKHYLKNEYDDLKEEYGFYEIKVVVHNHRDRALAWRGPQGPGRPMFGYPHILLVSY